MSVIHETIKACWKLASPGVDVVQPILAIRCNLAQLAQPGEKGVSILQKSRSDNLVAVVAHIAAGSIISQAGSLFIDLRTGANRRRVELVAALCEAAAGLAPRSHQAYQLAAYSRTILVTSEVAQPSAYDLTAEYHARASQLQRSPLQSCIGSKLQWVPPTPQKEVFLDVFIDNEHNSLNFTVETSAPPSERRSITGIGDVVWISYPPDLEVYGTLGAMRPFYPAEIRAIRPFSDADRSIVYSVYLNDFGEQFDVSAGETFSVPANKVGSKPWESDISTIRSFCNRIPGTIECVRQLARSVAEARVAFRDDPLTNASPFEWLSGGAWEENFLLKRFYYFVALLNIPINKFSVIRDPSRLFGFASTSKLSQDGEQFAYLASLTASLQSDATDLDPALGVELESRRADFEALSSNFATVVAAWTTSAVQNGLDPASDALLLHGLLNRPIASSDGPGSVKSIDDRVVGPAVASVAASFGRTLWLGHAPALEGDDQVLGVWSPAPAVAEARLLGLGPTRSDNSQRGGVVVIDNVFTSVALDRLLGLCLESTSFFDQKSGYFGAYMNDGFISGLLLQVAAHLRVRLPETIGKEVLSQIWAYK